jgi:hypothetical protein
VRPTVTLQIDAITLGAQKRGISETNNITSDGQHKNINDDKMGDPRLYSRSDRLSRRVPQKSSATAATTTTCAELSNSIVVRQSQYGRPGTIYDADLADFERNRRQH